MAAVAQSVPAQPVVPVQPVQEARPPVAPTSAEKALIPARGNLRSAAELEIYSESPVARMPVEVEVAVPLRDFRVRNLLALAAGAVVASLWSHDEDLPLSAGGVQLAWTEFEVLDTTLAARITRVA